MDFGQTCPPGFPTCRLCCTVIGVPYDGSASSRKGTALAPERLRFWSKHLTPFSEDRIRLGGLRVCDLGDISIDGGLAFVGGAGDRSDRKRRIQRVYGGNIAERGMRSVAASVYSKLSLCDAVHISLDIDCLDPAFAPGTGIPEAGGLSSREVITLIKSLRGLPLVGLDVVEVSPPIDPSEATVFAALKFIMEYMALFARAREKA